MTRLSIVALLAGCLRPYEAPDCAVDEVLNSDDECVASGDGDTAGDADADTDVDADADSDVSVSLFWSETGVNLDVSGSGPWSFGMAETGTDGWIGEDCIPDNTADTASCCVETCHSAQNGPNHWDTVGLDDFLADGGANDTLLTQSIADGGAIAYVLVVGDLPNPDACWVWGERNARTFYDDFGCTKITPSD